VNHRAHGQNQDEHKERSPNSPFQFESPHVATAVAEEKTALRNSDRPINRSLGVFSPLWKDSCLSVL
jgi:hypothetical protein